MANVEFGTGKTVLILTIVAACFAVLWPKIFYPMLMSPTAGKPQPDFGNGCCDVIFETDVNAMEVVSRMCGSILSTRRELDPSLSKYFQDGKFTREIVNVCRTEVMRVCGVDVAEFFNDKTRIDGSYKRILNEIRSYNVSDCLRQHFGVSPASIGIPRRIRIWGSKLSRHLRQERPLHFHPEMMHPALRERGRAIPHGNAASKISLENENGVRPPPIPGMRPPMGGAGHVVPAPKVGATMSIVMPLYTIGIVVFSMYTIMKVFIRKTGGSRDFHSDPEFRRVIFAEDFGNGCARSATERGQEAVRDASEWKSPADDATKLVMTAITGLLAEVDQQLSGEGDTQTQYSTDLKEQNKDEEEICTEGEQSFEKSEYKQSEKVDKWETLWYASGDRSDILHVPMGYDDSDTGPKVKVMEMETVAECEGGAKWSRPATPLLGLGGQSRGNSRPPHPDPDARNIVLEGSLPIQSQLLVTDSEVERLPVLDGEGVEPPVILSGKVTLSLISLDLTSSNESSQPILIQDSGSMLCDVDGKSAEYERREKHQYVTEKLDDDTKTIYTTADTEPDYVQDTEDTAADYSSMDPLDGAVEEEELPGEERILGGSRNRDRNDSRISSPGDSEQDAQQID